MPGESFTATSAGLPPVRGFLHRPSSPSSDGLVLTHGGGGNASAPLLVDLAVALAASGMTVLRCDLPFRQARRTGPPSRSSASVDRAGLAHAVSAVRALGVERVLLGGQSYGGRQASMLAAEEPTLVTALLLLSYPLHPPGRPAELRTAHFPKLRGRVVFIHGTSDPFGSTEEIEAARTLISGPTTLIVTDGGHDLGYRRSRHELIGRIVGACAFLRAPA
ncbi:MAG: alpha/beta hydrolase [Candidatus Rokubacteria bacterium 13_1_40CM_68_15]|nr:MAG: alpha/beta hydrolase [Candidatus Rokubacteria bacterium 13_1_40CM_68_15]